MSLGGHQETSQLTEKLTCKKLALSKLTFVCSVLDTPASFTEEVNGIIFIVSENASSLNFLLKL